jgi:site-specific DNA recombinase
MKRVGIWLRVSTEDQVRGESLEHHVLRARAYAEAKRWDVVEEYRLEAVSGKDVMSHPEMTRMLADVRAGRIDALIFSKLARLARSTKALLEVADIFQEHGADLISLGESIDTSTPAGRMFFTIIAAAGQWEREETSDRIARSVPVRAKLGKSTGGTGVYGYRWVEGKLVIDPEEAPIRRLIYELYYEHRRLRTVAAILNERGYRTRRNAAFSDTTLKFLIADPTAKGQRRANYNLTPGRNKGKQGRKPESEWIYTPVEPIVSEELWAACNAILTEREEIYSKRGRSRVNMFSSLVRCKCGETMYIDTPRKKYRCRAHQCGGKISLQHLETLFQSQIKAFYCSPDSLRTHLTKDQELIESKESLLQAQHRALAKIEQDKEKVLQAYLAGHLPDDAFGEYHFRFGKDKERLEQEIATLAGELDYLRAQDLSHEQTARDAEEIFGRWDDFSEKEKTILIQSITDRILVQDEGVTLNLLYAPSFFQTVAEKSFENAMNGCSSVAFSNVSRVQLTIRREAFEGEPPKPFTAPMGGGWGRHIYHTRKQRGQTLEQIAPEIGVYWETIYNWEKGHYGVRYTSIPRIVEYLGYVPIAESPLQPTLGEALRAARRLKGWSITDLRRKLRVEHGTVLKWERNQGLPPSRTMERLQSLLDANFSRYVADTGESRRQHA